MPPPSRESMIGSVDTTEVLGLVPRGAAPQDVAGDRNGSDRAHANRVFSLDVKLASSTSDLTAADDASSLAIVDTDGDGDGDRGANHEPLRLPSPDRRHSSSRPDRRRIGTLPLSVLVFYSVSGGPIGIEPAVRSGGFLPSLLGFLLAPLAWSVPEALITAELGSAFPEASGSVAWVEEAFGSVAGFASGWFTWVAGATDNAVYPVLFLDYLLQVVGSGGSDGDGGMEAPARFALLTLMSVALAFINYSGLEIVGNMSIIICAISLSPFLLLTVLGAPKVDPRRWLETGSTEVVGLDDDGLNAEGWLPFANLGGVLWRPFLNNLFWNLNSFDSAANFAGEVVDPGRVFPRAMFVALFLVVVTYFVPLLVAIGASNGTRADWTDGYLAKVCSDAVAPWLGGWTVFAAGISNIALFMSEMSADAFQIMGMAERGLIPKFFATKSRFGTPTYGILLGTLVIIMMSVADFTSLVEMMNLMYSVALLMEYAAFIKLRLSHSDVPRPYRIPLNTVGCVLFVTPPVLTTIFVMALASYMTYIFCLAALAFGALIYIVQSCGKEPFCLYSTITDTSLLGAGEECELDLT